MSGPTDPSSVSRPAGALGGYDLQGLLGSGAMGMVFRARHRASGREVALKVIRAAGPEVSREARFRREAELARSLSHPGIVRVLDAGEAGGVPFIAFELVQGARTLREVLVPLDRAARAALVRDVARAIGHAHFQGIVHRDLKPENVLVGRDGVPRVTDFGLATARGVARLTRTGAMIGTPVYMAPEQFAAERDRVGPTADVWSLGVMLFEALVDEPPFPPDASLMELAVQVRHGAPAAHTIEPSVPRALSDVCARALAVEPGARFADGEALARALDEALGQRRRRRGRAAPRRRWPWLVAGAATLALSLGSTLFFALSRALDEPAPSTVLVGEAAPVTTAQVAAPPPPPGPPSAAPVRAVVLEAPPGPGGVAVMEARFPTVLWLEGVGPCALVRLEVVDRGAPKSEVALLVSDDGGRRWSRCASTSDRIPVALQAGLLAGPAGTVHVAVLGGDIFAGRTSSGWCGTFDLSRRTWTEPLEALLGMGEEMGCIAFSAATDERGAPVVVGTSPGFSSAFRRVGHNGWTPPTRVSEVDTSHPVVAPGPDGVLHFVYVEPRPGAPSLVRYRRWDGFDWVPSQPLTIDRGGAQDLQLETDRDGTLHLLYRVDRELRYARRRPAEAGFEVHVVDRSADPPVPGRSDFALVVTPRVGAVAARQDRLVLWDLTQVPPGAAERVVDLGPLSGQPTINVARHAPPGRRVMALVGVRNAGGSRVEVVIE